MGGTEILVMVDVRSLEGSGRWAIRNVLGQLIPL